MPPAAARANRWHGPDTFVLFGDMLGFADLVADDPEDTDEDRLARVHDEWLIQHRPAYRSWDEPAQARTHTFERQYLLFNRLLTKYVNDLHLKSTVIVFSDSFFVAVDDGAQLLHFAAQLMAAMIVNVVPVRMGIAQGGFCLHETATLDLITRRARTVQFLGRGVVLAHRTESRGLKGLRIGLHPNVIESLRLDGETSVVTPLPEGEPAGVARFELNYLSPYFIAGPRPHELRRDIRKGVASMRERAEGKPEVLIHYVRTEEAQARMVESGRRSFARRRKSPRKTTPRLER